MKLRPYGKAELALLYQPCSSPETAQKTLYRWIIGCPPLMAELKKMNYNPKRRTFLIPEVEAIVKHLGEPCRAFGRNTMVFALKRQGVSRKT